MDSTVKWPGWETTKLLGEGSFGRVYEIERQIYGHTEKAALKWIRIPRSQSELRELYADGYDANGIRQRYEALLKHVYDEYGLMIGLKDSPNIVRCDDVRIIRHEDVIGWDLLIKMELLTPLAAHLPQATNEENVIRIGIDLCRALEACEKKQILHRDIKPENVFVSQDGVYKLGDFGIAKIADGTMSGTMTGTYKYMAPEVYHNSPYGKKADIYSLGMVLYWLLNQQREPFVNPDRFPTQSEIDAARKRRFSGEEPPLPKNGSETLRRIVCRACAPDPEKRFQSAEELRLALETMDASVGAQTARASAKKRGDHRPGAGVFRKAAIGCAAVAVLAAAVIGGTLLKKEPAAEPTAAISVSAEPEESPKAETVFRFADSEALSLTLGEPQRLELTLSADVDASKLQWSSSDPEIAAVDANGTVAGIAPGTAEITAAYGKDTVSRQVNVSVRALKPFMTINEAERGYFLKLYRERMHEVETRREQFQSVQVTAGETAFFDEGRLYVVEVERPHLTDDLLNDECLYRYYYDSESDEVYCLESRDSNIRAAQYYQGVLYRICGPYGTIHDEQNEDWEEYQQLYDQALALCRQIADENQR